MMKFKSHMQILVALVMLLGFAGGIQGAQAQSSAVVVVRDLTYWDATYTGYVDANRFEEWPVVFTAAEDFTVTAAPDGGSLTTLVVLKDATGTEIARGDGALTSSQPAGNYFVQVQPVTGSGFYHFTIRRVEIEDPTDPQTPSASASANPVSIKVGETSTVSVSLNNLPAEGYASAEFSCTYEMNGVEVNAITFTDLFGADPATAVNGPAGGGFIAAVAGSNGRKATTTGVVFTFDVKGLQTGTTVITCVPRVSKGDNTLTTLDAVSVTLTVTDEVVVVENATLTGQVFAGKPVTVSLYDAANILVKTVVANPDGSFSLTAPAGTYTATAEASGFLAAEGPVTLVANETSVKAAVTLPAGDIDGNDVIDQFDAMTIGMNYNASQPASADLNNDGVINVLDLELLASNYRLTGPVVWP
ncbi:MAG: hypothetical protein HXY42_12940 [Chloroflexi bacterium]|nr:hypothetical protein [Chloroflexota bacterium]